MLYQILTLAAIVIFLHSIYMNIRTRKLLNEATELRDSLEEEFKERVRLFGINTLKEPRNR